MKKSRLLYETPWDSFIHRIKSWFDWSDLFDNEFDWSQEGYEGEWYTEAIKELYSRND